MANHAGTDHGVPDDHVDDGDSEVGVQITGDIAANGNGPEEVTLAKKSAQHHLLPVLPIVLGVFICALNIFVAAWLWQNVYQSNFDWLTSMNLPTTAFLALLIISLFIGLFLIAYAIVLRHFERNRPSGEMRQESMANHQAGQVPSYVKWIIVPVLVALPAPVLTVWAAQLIEPIAPKPCIELYQEAQSIKNDSPNFRMYGYDRDQFRCSINGSLQTN